MVVPYTVGALVDQTEIGRKSINLCEECKQKKKLKSCIPKVIDRELNYISGLVRRQQRRQRRYVLLNNRHYRYCPFGIYAERVVVAAT